MVATEKQRNTYFLLQNAHGLFGRSVSASWSVTSELVIGSRSGMVPSGGTSIVNIVFRNVVPQCELQMVLIGPHTGFETNSPSPLADHFENVIVSLFTFFHWHLQYLLYLRGKAWSIPWIDGHTGRQNFHRPSVIRHHEHTFSFFLTGCVLVAHHVEAVPDR